MEVPGVMYEDKPLPVVQHTSVLGLPQASAPDMPSPLQRLLAGTEPKLGQKKPEA